MGGLEGQSIPTTKKFTVDLAGGRFWRCPAPRGRIRVSLHAGGHAGAVARAGGRGDPGRVPAYGVQLLGGLGLMINLSTKNRFLMIFLEIQLTINDQEKIDSIDEGDGY